MCGRLFFQPTTDLEEAMGALGLSPQSLPTLNNIAPTEQVPVIYRHGDEPKLRSMRWWLHPHWSKDAPNQKYATFNARIETVQTSPSFRDPVKRHRGLIPARAFVEWKTEDKIKHPFFIEGLGQPLLLAAIWDVWHDDLFSCAIITQPENSEFADIHSRMPLALNIAQAKDWLDLQSNSANLLKQLTGSCIKLSTREISTAVNNARHKGEVELLNRP